MRRTLSFTLISLITVLLAACSNSSGTATPPPESAESVANPCAQPAAAPKEGETPECADGCKWNGTECRQERGIIVNDSRPKPPRPTNSDQ